MLKKLPTYKEVYNSFQWNIPEFCNIGVDVCDRWANDKKRLALVFEDENGKTTPYTFHDIKLFTNKLANGLIACGINQGDRVGILLPQSPETAIAHVATYKIAAIAIPLFTLFGTDALQYRLENSEAKAIVTNADNLPKILEIWENLPHLKTVIVTDGDHPETMVGFWDLIEKGSTDFSPVKTKAEDPALIIYTSGTTGHPKGTLHAHRTVLGHLPGVEFPQNFFPQKGDFFWTPADWAWIGGLIDVLLPSWHHGIPVLAHRARKFDPEEAFHLLSKHRIRNAFMPPTALKLMRQVSNPRERYSYDIRSIGSGGETLGEELLQWGMKELGVSINEFYGQTECNLVVGCCSEVMEIRPGSMGKPVPGRVVEVIDQNGNILPPGTIGEIAVLRPDPVMFLEYWKNPEATQKKFINDWLLTGDTGKKDEDGYLWFNGRTDDIITSSGYRIGPAEIEDCVLKHPAVTMAAVIGSPDPVRTEIVKAFVMLKPDLTPSADLESELKEFVKTRLAAHEYPREIEFVDKLPMTATGKIVRRELKQLEVDRKKGKPRMIS
jgi:acetyl-CoA synthetase